MHTQLLELYSTSWLQSFEALFHIATWYRQLCFQVSLRVSEGSQVGGLKATWSGKLSDSRLQNSHPCLLQNWKKELRC